MRLNVVQHLTAALLLAAGAAHAADPTPISETKRQLMLELFELTGGERTSDQLTQVMLAQMEQSQAALIEQLVSSTSRLSADEQAQLREKLAGAQGPFAKFRARLPERVDFLELTRTVVMPIYDRCFDEQDLREMVAFYRTPAGRKSVSLLPQIAQETTQAVAERVQPRVVELVEEIIADEAAALHPDGGS